MAGKAKFTYDRATGVYRYAASGRAVPQKQIRDVLDEVRSASGTKMRGWADDLINGGMTGTEFFGLMTAEVRRLGFTAGLAGAGGKENLTDAVRQQIEDKVAEQLEYLREFSKAWGNQELDEDGRVVARAEMYAGSAHSVYESSRRSAMQDAGVDEERAVLDDSAQHCDDCLARADQGWVAAGELSDIGDSECGNNCRCELEYRTRQAGEDDEGD